MSYAYLKFVGMSQTFFLSRELEYIQSLYISHSPFLPLNLSPFSTELFSLEIVVSPCSFSQVADLI